MRATEVLAAGRWDGAREVGQMLADAEQRLRRRLRLQTVAGMPFLLDLPRVMRLGDGDGLVLEDGGIIRVVAAPEALLEITAFDDHTLTRVAWHLGQRHVPVQFLRHRLRVREERLVAELIERLGCEAAPVSAPFDPEPGAYRHD